MLLRQLASASRKDAGLARFEILQRTSPSREFVILESWKDQQAFDAHVASAHHKLFRDNVGPHLIAPLDDRLSVPTLIGPSQAAGGGVYVVTHVDVPGPVRDKGLAALTALSGPSRKDTGNLRFDVVHQKNRTNHFTVVEVWKDLRSNDAHELAAHTRAFRNALMPITGALYDQRWYRPL
jgi:quinol monooxygenase YgiN